jgi:Uma2 family endonuclease
MTTKTITPPLPRLGPFSLKGDLPVKTNGQAAIEYPESDGKPMGETGIHVMGALSLYSALRMYFAKRTDMYIAANMFMYYREGSPRHNKVPDLMVIKGLSNNDERRTFKTWEEGAVPCVIVEFTSRSTAREDTGTKARLYAELGVPEYYIFDPFLEHLDTTFWGYELVGDHYVRRQPNRDGSFYSTELGLILRPAGNYIRTIEPVTGRLIPSHMDAIEMHSQERERAIIAQQRAQQEILNAQREAQRAEQEAQRAGRAEAEVEQLRQELARLKEQNQRL